MKAGDIVTLLAAGGGRVRGRRSLRAARLMYKTRGASGAPVWILFCLLLPSIGTFFT